MFELFHGVMNVGVTVRATLSQHKEDSCFKVRALVTFMFVWLLVLQRVQLTFGGNWY